MKVRRIVADGFESFLAESKMNKLSVLMPVYNESRTLRSIVKLVLNSPVTMDIELVCVDDGSSDGSLDILNELAEADSRVKVIAQPRNMGKGKAIRTAIDHMTGDIGIIQDADLEYDPAQYQRMVAPILEGIADAVYGSRFASSEMRRVLFFWHSLGNRILTTLSNMANDLNLTDMETCYKAVRADVLKSLRLTSDRFGFEPEITARLAHIGARIYEVPISYRGRTYAEGKTVGWRAGVEALWLIFKFKFLDPRASNSPGHLTLESLATTPGVAKWMLSNFEDFLGERVLEAGCGSGNVTQHLIDRRKLALVEIDPVHLQSMERRFGHLENVQIVRGDLEDLSLYENLDRFDSVLCINVLEHLDKPEIALEGFKRVLKGEGNALILVPAHQWLFSRTDVVLEHRKRFTREDVRDLLQSAQFEVLSCREFNRLGVLGWLTNKLTGRTAITRWQARLFGFLLPVAKVLERFTFLPGLSIVAVARLH
ncbi:MAG: glycosyltransferase [Acidimicrobiia bacterium]